MTSTAVGALGSTRQVLVDDHGTVEPFDVTWTLHWWIGADDRWHDPTAEPAVRQTFVDAAPVARTAMRVPGGDAVQHVYAAGGPDLIVVDVENQSPAPFVLALVVLGACGVALLVAPAHSASLASRSHNQQAFDALFDNAFRRISNL